MRSRSSPRRAWLWSGSPTSGMLMSATWPLSASCDCAGPKSGSFATDSSNRSIAAVTSVEVTSPETTTWAGSVVEAPGKLRSSARAPDLAKESSGRELTPAVPVWRPRTGKAAASSTSTPAARKVPGRRTTALTALVQKGLSAGWSRPTTGSRSALTRSPSRDSKAGSKVMAAAMVTTPTMIAPSARLRRMVSGTRSRPSRATTKELPENRTALLLVPPVVMIASILSRPACRSSR